ncbi:Rep family protein [Escherichia coli]|uniref:Rep family protein n=1 Tax=Escherichia coli TaxID=562 RepID=UPI003D65B59C
MSERINKARYWQAVMYPENMVEGWQDRIADIVQVPFAYCVHSEDTDEKSEHRKDHIHLIIVFPNTTTYKHAMSVFGLLGDKALNTCEACVNIRHCYDYLIHDTESCRKAGKHEYDPSERITGNNFDIGAYEQISTEEKQGMLQELVDYALAKKIMNMADFMLMTAVDFGAEYFGIIVGYNAMLERICRGNYLKYSEQKEAENGAKNEFSCCYSNTQQHENLPQQHACCCPECGSLSVKKHGKTSSEQQRYQCKDCGKTFV